MKAYVINLDSRPQNMERLLATMAPLMRASLIQLERVPAVDMTGFDVRDPSRNTAKLDIVRKHVSTTALMTMLRNQRYSHEQFDRPGAIGCYLSHVGIWRKIAAAEEGAMVIEDDAVFTDQEAMAQVMRAVQNKRLPPRLDLLLVGWRNHMSVDGHDDGDNDVLTLGPHVRAHRVRRWFTGMYMYYVTPVGAKKMLQTALPIEVHVDAYIGRRLDPQLCRLLGVEPLLVYGVRRSRDGWALVDHDGAHGSSIQHGPCNGCGEAEDLAVVVDARGRSRSSKQAAAYLVEPSVVAAALLVAIAVGALLFKVLVARRQARRIRHS